MLLLQSCLYSKAKKSSGDDHDKVYSFGVSHIEKVYKLENKMCAASMILNKKNGHTHKYIREIGRIWDQEIA